MNPALIIFLFSHSCYDPPFSLHQSFFAPFCQCLFLVIYNCRMIWYVPNLSPLALLVFLPQQPPYVSEVFFHLAPPQKNVTLPLHYFSKVFPHSFLTSPPEPFPIGECSERGFGRSVPICPIFLSFCVSSPISPTFLASTERMAPPLFVPLFLNRVPLSLSLSKPPFPSPVLRLSRTALLPLLDEPPFPPFPPSPNSFLFSLVSAAFPPLRSKSP